MVIQVTQIASGIEQQLEPLLPDAKAHTLTHCKNAIVGR